MCFKAWEGKDKGKEDSKDDAMQSEMEKDGLFLIMGKVLHVFFSSQSCRPCILRGCF